jgi:uncharacterized protein YbbC (DUF1343 family)
VKYLLHIVLLCVSLSGISQVKVGAEQTQDYLPLLKNKTVALVVNPTSVIKETHLVDSLKNLGINIKAIFAPEHGFRGDAEAGAHIKSGVDAKTQISVLSLYGNKKKPSSKDLEGVDIVVFDIQDVGARFYTYISTLHYIMEACAENKIPLLVLDRPNPNGHYVDGPVLDPKFKSFVGMHQVPVVHGMTIAEYAQMINGEKWLPANMQCELFIIECKNYTHSTFYKLPIKPSPNLPTMAAIYLYPSLCFFEGTDVSVGRGTDKPFEIIGKPNFEQGSYEFTPKSIKGVSENPKYKGQKCKGIVLTDFGDSYMPIHASLYLTWLVNFYKESPNKEKFFNSFFDKLAGTDQLRNQIIAGKSLQEIRNSWEPELTSFKNMRKKYLLYAE